MTLDPSQFSVLERIATALERLSPLRQALLGLIKPMHLCGYQSRAACYP
ncbi:ATPase AAA [Acetobacter orientalis]|uniref:ATPase AAA n=1 Tax=Acetobacter orientalis TaxID=146474 RepID=A0A2Z5ZF50_9PROT|nr:ATPase AAA [Acetobacter orientalis]